MRSLITLWVRDSSTRFLFYRQLNKDLKKSNGFLCLCDVLYYICRKHKPLHLWRPAALPSLPPLQLCLRPYLNFRFSINCSIVTSSSSTKSDFPNSRPSSSAIPVCSRWTHQNKRRTRRKGTESSSRKKKEKYSWQPGSVRVLWACSLVDF